MTGTMSRPMTGTGIGTIIGGRGSADTLIDVP
jgi:hypothetical protein